MSTKAERSHAQKRELLRASIDRGVSSAAQHPIVQEAQRVYRLARALSPGTKYVPGSLVAVDWDAIIQLTRSVSSIGANVIEGTAKSDPVDMLRFFRTSRGSAYEAYYWGELLNVDFLKDIEQLGDVCN